MVFKGVFRVSLGEVAALGKWDILGVGRRGGSCEDFHCWVGEEMLGGVRGGVLYGI